MYKIKVKQPTCDKISKLLFFTVAISQLESQVFQEWTIESFENLKHLREGLCSKCNIWRSVNNNLELANVLSYHASCKVYGLWITLLFRMFFGTTSLEKRRSRNLLLDCSLLAGDQMQRLFFGVAYDAVSIKCRAGWKHAMNQFKLKHYYFYFIGDWEWHKINFLDGIFCNSVA